MMWKDMLGRLELASFKGRFVRLEMEHYEIILADVINYEI